MDRKEEYAVYINDGKEWKQYSVFEPLKEAQKDFKAAKKKEYVGLKLVQRVTTVNEIEVYEERNGHLISGNSIFVDNVIKLINERRRP